MILGCMVRKGKMYATGARTWTAKQRRAFLFTDAAGGPLRNGKHWALEHLRSLRSERGLPAGKWVLVTVVRA